MKVGEKMNDVQVKAICELVISIALLVFVVVMCWLAWRK